MLRIKMCYLVVLRVIMQTLLSVVGASFDRRYWSADPIRYQTHKVALFDRVVVCSVLPAVCSLVTTSIRYPINTCYPMCLVAYCICRSVKRCSHCRMTLLYTTTHSMYIVSIF